MMFWFCWQGEEMSFLLTQNKYCQKKIEEMGKLAMQGKQNASIIYWTTGMADIFNKINIKK